MTSDVVREMKKRGIRIHTGVSQYGSMVYFEYGVVVNGRAQIRRWNAIVPMEDECLKIFCDFIEVAYNKCYPPPEEFVGRECYVCGKKFDRTAWNERHELHEPDCDKDGCDCDLVCHARCCQECLRPADGSFPRGNEPPRGLLNSCSCGSGLPQTVPGSCAACYSNNIKR